MDTNQLSLLTEEMSLETDGGPNGEESCHPVVNGKAVDIPITEAQLPNGRRIKLLKTFLTSACERNCYYCPFRAGRDMRRATYKPEEMAKTFIKMHERGVVEGIFLSSGVVGGGVRTQDQLIDAADILRRKYHFRGYLHLKVMPGAERDQVERAMHLASRLSVNLEAPNDKRLQELAPRKEFSKELVQPLRWIEQIRREKSPHRTWNQRWPSTTTQFVVGAVGETDLELVSTSEYLYAHTRLQRAYFMAFRPIPDTPMENLPAASSLRQSRLYQSSFLLRDYGFSLEEMPFTKDGNLPLDVDPKLALAQATLSHKPLEINRASRKELLRIPGIGPAGVKKILHNRRKNKIKGPEDLRRIGINPKRAAPFILLDGVRPVFQKSLL